MEHRRVAARHGERPLDDQLGAGGEGDRDDRAVDLAGADRPDDHADFEPMSAGMGEADAEPTAIAVGRRHDLLAIDARPGLIPAGPVLLEERDQPASIGIEVDVERPGPVGSGACAEADGVDADPKGRPPPEGRREGPVERLGNEGCLAALLRWVRPLCGAQPPNDEHRERLLRRGGVGRRRRRAGGERLPGGGGSRRQEQCHEEEGERATPPADGLPEERGDRQPPQAGASQAVERQRHPQACDGEGDRHEESPHATGGEKPEGREGETDQQRTPPQPARVDQTDAHPGTAPGALHEDPLAEAGVDRSLPARWGRDLGPGARSAPDRHGEEALEPTGAGSANLAESDRQRDDVDAVGQKHLPDPLEHRDIDPGTGERNIPGEGGRGGRSLGADHEPDEAPVRREIDPPCPRDHVGHHRRWHAVDHHAPRQHSHRRGDGHPRPAMVLDVEAGFVLGHAGRMAPAGRPLVPHPSPGLVITIAPPGHDLGRGRERR